MPLLSSDSDSDDEEAIEARRKEAAEKRRLENEAVKKRRREAEAASEAKWFEGAKEARIEKISFEEHLTRKSIFLSADEKTNFTDNTKADIVSHFQRNIPNFDEQISKITEIDELLHLIYKAHKPITTDRDDEESAANVAIHEILCEFQKPVVGALKEMTQIPKEENIMELETGNVFFEARERILNEEREKISMDFMEMMDRRERERVQQIRERIDEEAQQLGRLLTNDEGEEDVDLVLQEFSRMALEQEMNPVRGTSPTPIQLSEDALAQLTALTNRMTIDPAVREVPGAQQEEEADESMSDSDEDIGDDFMFAALREPDNYATPIDELRAEVKIESGMEMAGISEDMNGYSLRPPEKANPRDYHKVREDSNYNEMSTEEVLSIIRDPHQLPTEKERELADWLEKKLEKKKQFVMNQEVDAKTDEHMAQIREWLERRDWEVPTKKKVRIAPFDSTLNRFRIFVKPGGIIRRQTHYDPDEGPGHEWKEMGLKEGWDLVKERKTKHPMTIKGQKFKLAKSDRKTLCVQRLVKNEFDEWMIGYRGNLLGRFWYFPLDEYYNYQDTSNTNVKIEDYEYWHECRRQLGLNLVYRVEDLVNLYGKDWSVDREILKRSLDRKVKGKDKKLAKVASVLVLTDWRLAFLDHRVLMNAVVKYVPSELGEGCFKSLIAYLDIMLTNPRLEINTIIFAMGGSPKYKLEYFDKFLRKLTVLCFRHVNVHWYAQDWLDGLKFTHKEAQYFFKWNDCVERSFRMFREDGHLNYHFHNVRKMAKLHIEPPSKFEEGEQPYAKQRYSRKPNLELLERIYNLYVRHFGNHAGVILHRNFFATHNRSFNDHAENSSLNPQCAIVHRHDEKNPYKGEEVSEEYGY